MPYLSKRLQTVFNLIPDGSYVADIGTDHAYLPIALSLCGKAKRVIACDIKEKPLLIARKNLDKSGCTFVETRLGNGLESIKQNETDCVVIAGMGGEVISGILENWPFTRNSDILFILQPMTCAGEIRSWLCKNGFSYTETAVCDNKKLYTVISARFDGITKSISAKEFFVGALSADTNENTAYIEKQLKIVSKCVIGLKNAEDKKAEYLFYLEAEKELKKLLE